MAELVWQLEAIDDLEQISSYIARQSPDFAPVFAGRIIDATERLRIFPESGRVIPELQDDSLREVIFQNYRIIYWHEDNQVIVLGIVHSALNFPHLAESRGWHLL